MKLEAAADGQVFIWLCILDFFRLDDATANPFANYSWGNLSIGRCNRCCTHLYRRNTIVRSLLKTFWLPLLIEWHDLPAHLFVYATMPSACNTLRCLLLALGQKNRCVFFAATFPARRPCFDANETISSCTPDEDKQHSTRCPVGLLADRELRQHRRQRTPRA